jgi:hypothetical protein
MATATATEPIDLAETATPEPAPTEKAVEPGPLARLLTPVEPARPVHPLGTTAAMEQPAEDTSSSKKGSAKADAAKPADRDGAVTALVRALAARLGRTGTTTKRSHTLTETRGAVASSRSDRSAKSSQTGQDPTSRKAKAADLSSKAAQRPGRDTADTRKTGATAADTKAPRPIRDTTAPGSNAAKPDSTVKRDISTKAAGPARTKGSTAAKADKPSKPDASARPAAADPARKADPKGLNAKTTPAAKPTSTKRDGLTKTTSPKSATKQAEAEPAAKSAAKELRTKPAREAGYRDGTRVAAVAGHAKAYRDGTKDGWDDQAAADRAEKERMDKARIRNAIKPKTEDPKMTPAAGSTADLAKKTAPPTPAVPVQVDAVGTDSIHFTGVDGVTSEMTRGEVRTLKHFERSLAERQQVMGRIAEGSKVTRALAVELSTRAQRLAEGAKEVKGGTALVGVLLRLAERAQALRNRAEEIETHAHRGAEAVKVLAANAETRHGGIYKAVVESPLTKPAEKEFYQDKAGT